MHISIYSYFFLSVAYLLGHPVLGYSLEIGKEHVNLIDERLQKLIYSGQLDEKELDRSGVRRWQRSYHPQIGKLMKRLFRLAVISMAGLAAEGLKYEKVVGQSADLFSLQRFINRSKPQLSKEQQQNLTRWAVIFFIRFEGQILNSLTSVQVLLAASLLKNNKSAHEALISAMSSKSSVLDCIKAVENAG
ncbi:hypothetical protein EJ110_NYTH49350 [Nymphaea thermarum]|nr:hypothetical protein EJ110_NYTH49350 [Nymphaea thermarum]